MRDLAIYDMDKTITRAPTWTPFLIHAARRVAPWRLALLPLAGLATMAYALKAIDRARLKEVTQGLMIGRSLSPEQMADVADAFAEAVLAAGVFEGARARIAADRAAGYTLVLATASYGFYARAIAARLGMDHVVATRSKVTAEGHIVSRIEGENCYGPAKLRMILHWMQSHGIERNDVHVRFYSDHVSDAPVLAWADEAFAVNPHGPLRTMAKARGWQIIDWERG